MRRLLLALGLAAAFAVAGAPSCDSPTDHCRIGADAYAADTGSEVVDVEPIDRTSLGDACQLTLDDGTEVEILVDLTTHTYRVL